MKKRDPEELFSDDELLERLAREVQNDDVQDNLIPLPTFEYVVKKYTKELYFFAWKLVKQREAAEDVLQVAFFNAHKAMKKYPPERILNLLLRAWLYRITLNAAIRFLDGEKRTRGRETSIDNLEAIALAQPVWNRIAVDVETQVEQHEKFEAFINAFNTLSKEKQIAFYLKAGCGLKYREISEILNTRVGTIRARISRARRELHDILGSDYPEYFNRQDDEEGE